MVDGLDNVLLVGHDDGLVVGLVGLFELDVLDVPVAVSRNT